MTSQSCDPVGRFCRHIDRPDRNHTASTRSLRPAPDTSDLSTWWWECDLAFYTSHSVFCVTCYLPFVPLICFYILCCVIVPCFVFYCVTLHILSHWAPQAASTSSHCRFLLRPPDFECRYCRCLFLSHTTHFTANNTRFRPLIASTTHFQASLVPRTRFSSSRSHSEPLSSTFLPNFQAHNVFITNSIHFRPLAHSSTHYRAF